MIDMEADVERYEIMRGLLGGIGDGVILTDLDENVVYINRAAVNMLKCRDQISERTVSFNEICPLENLLTGEPFESPLKHAMRVNKSVGLARNVGIQLNGEDVYLSATCSPRRTSDGKMAGCSVILRNVTNIRKLELKVEADHFYMRSVFAAAKIGLCILDSGGGIVDVNEAGLDIPVDVITSAISQVSVNATSELDESILEDVAGGYCSKGRNWKCFWSYMSGVLDGIYNAITK